MDERALAARYLREKMSDGETYVVALVVGCMINAYGHLFVPLVSGETSVVDHFLGRLDAAPFGVISSIVIAFVFPILVGVYSSVKTRWRTRDFEIKCEFPDKKPDPVFRADPDGRIVSGGASTMRLFRESGIQSADELLGAELWARLLDHHSRGDQLPPKTQAASNALGRRFLVAHSPSQCGGVNVYLTFTGVVGEAAND